MRNILIILFSIIFYFAIKSWYQSPKFEKGEYLQDFSGMLKNGATFELKQLYNNYVLVDFWASWCGPCRQKNPNLVKVYDLIKNQKFKSAKGFEIVSIGIEKNPDSWHKAILNDRLNWPYHIIDKTDSFKFFDGPIAKKFGVNSVPANYLISPDGKIIQSNLTPEEMLNFLRNDFL